MPQCKTKKGLLKVFLRQGLLTLSFLPDPQILSTLFLILTHKKQCFQVLFHTRGQPPLSPCPSRAPRECPPSQSTLLLQHVLQSSLSRTGGKSQEGKPQKSNPNGTSTLSSDLPFLYALSCSTCCKASPNL